MHETAMNDDNHMQSSSAHSISGGSAVLYFSRDPSIAQLLVSYGVTMRDFILVSFLSDQGPLSVNQLARIVCIDPCDLQKSVTRLAIAGLVTRDPESPNAAPSSNIRLTSHGQDIASRIEKQL